MKEQGGNIRWSAGRDKQFLYDSWPAVLILASSKLHLSFRIHQPLTASSIKDSSLLASGLCSTGGSDLPSCHILCCAAGIAYLAPSGKASLNGTPSGSDHCIGATSAASGMEFLER